MIWRIIGYGYWLVPRLAMHEWMNKISYTIYRQPIINRRPRLYAIHTQVHTYTACTPYRMKALLLRRWFPISIRFSVFLCFSVSTTFISMHHSLPSFNSLWYCLFLSFFGSHQFYGTVYLLCVCVCESDQSIRHKHTDLFSFEVTLIRYCLLVQFFFFFFVWENWTAVMTTKEETDDSYSHV